MKKQQSQKPQPKQPKKEEKKNKPLLCKSYKGFGRFSMAAGLIFLAAAFVLGFNSVRIAVAAFFLILGAVDLLFYSRYGDHSTTLLRKGLIQKRQ